MCILQVIIYFIIFSAIMSVPALRDKYALISLLKTPEHSSIANTIYKHCNVIGIWSLRRTHMFFYTSLCDDGINANICSASASHGYLGVLKWARERGYEWDDLTCAYAAENGHLDILKWARKYGCDWNPDTCGYAALNGHLEVLKWAREYGCNWNAWTCILAAENGHFEVLQWAVEHGCDWDPNECSTAAKCKVRKVLIARKRGRKKHRRRANIVIDGHLKVIRWIHDNYSK